MGEQVWTFPSFTPSFLDARHPGLIALQVEGLNSQSGEVCHKGRALVGKQTQLNQPLNITIYVQQGERTTACELIIPRNGKMGGLFQASSPDQNSSLCSISAEYLNFFGKQWLGCEVDPDNHTSALAIGMPLSQTWVFLPTLYAGLATTFPIFTTGIFGKTTNWLNLVQTVSVLTVILSPTPVSLCPGAKT